MTVYVYRNGRLVPKSTAGSRASGRSVHVISDAMADTWHPCDGRMYDSKSNFRSVTRAHGGIEIGNENPMPRAPEPDRTIKADIARAIAELGG